jgi:hypothetical protein
MILMKTSIVRVGLLIAALAWAGCVALKPYATSEPLSGAPSFPPVDASEVKFYRDPPPQYVAIAQIRVRWSGLMLETDIARSKEVEHVLRQEAARLGANAITSIAMPRKRLQSSKTLGDPDYVDHLVCLAIRMR